jgi:hypothetical protein
MEGGDVAVIAYADMAREAVLDRRLRSMPVGL